MTGAASTDPNRLLAQAESAFGAGNLDEAERHLAQLRSQVTSHPAPFHLSALVAKRRGQPDAAAGFFEQALRLGPNDPQILTNYGNLLGDVGRNDDALAAYDRALRSAPGFDSARLNRAAMLQRLDRHEEALAQLSQLSPAAARTGQACSIKGYSLLAKGELAEAAEAFDTALALEPRRTKALVGRASVAMLRGESAASDLLARGVAQQPGDKALMLQFAEAVEARGDERAIPLMEEAVRRSPDWADGHRTLARMRWEAGDSTGFTTAIEERLAQTPGKTELWQLLVDVLASADLHAQAADTARRGRRVVGDDVSLLAVEALHSSEAGDLAAADKAFALLNKDVPGAAVAEARHRLRTGELDRAEQLVATELERDRWSVQGWALQGLLWRLRNDPRNEWLHEQPGLTSVQQLKLDKEDIAAIASCLRGLHQTRAHPLGQSLRGGTQTRGRLFDRIEPEVVQLREAIASALSSYWKGLPDLDESHPLLRHAHARPTFAGSWSVRLTDGGFHVAHIHPRGVVSSACYLVVPDNEGSQGYLDIGGPPPELGLDLPPLTSFQPVPGRMILFPSTMFHGTQPFPAGERLTAAFDIVAG